MFQFISDSPADQQFGVAIDDRTYEDSSVAIQDFRLVMAQGYSAQFYSLKGNLSRALTKIKNHSYFEQHV